MNWSCCGIWCSIVGEEIRLWAGHPRNHGSIRGGGKRPLISEMSRPVLELYQTSYSVGSMDSFRGMKWQGREDDDSLQSSASVKNEWRYISPPHYILMVCTGTAWSLPLLKLLHANHTPTTEPHSTSLQQTVSGTVEFFWSKHQ